MPTPACPCLPLPACPQEGGPAAELRVQQKIIKKSQNKHERHKLRMHLNYDKIHNLPKNASVLRCAVRSCTYFLADILATPNTAPSLDRLATPLTLCPAPSHVPAGALLNPGLRPVRARNPLFFSLGRCDCLLAELRLQQCNNSIRMRCVQ